MLAAAISPTCHEKTAFEFLKQKALGQITNLTAQCRYQKTQETHTDRTDLWDIDLFPDEPTPHDCRIPEFFSQRRSHADLKLYPCILNLFLKYNTPLATSAPVERAFSRAKHVMTFDRTRLGDETFEFLTILRAGIH